jgi:hypothetical protein
MPMLRDFGDLRTNSSRKAEILNAAALASNARLLTAHGRK